MMSIPRIVVIGKAEAVMRVEPTNLCMKPLMAPANIDVRSRLVCCRHEASPLRLRPSPYC